MKKGNFILFFKNLNFLKFLEKLEQKKKQKKTHI